MTASLVCPKGHASTDPDFCSECGTKMTSVAVVEKCPQCGMERTPGARFCETCRYDFRSGTPGPPPDPDPVVALNRLWEAVITVDAALDTEPDPELPCPVNDPERCFPLDVAENLVGRRSQSRGVFPAISLSDPGVSHRHLMIYRDPSGNLSVADLGSTNGTYLNGASDPLQSGVKTPVGPSDRVEIGRWTRITFRPRG